MYVPSLTSSPCTVAALCYDFTDQVLLTDEVSIVWFVDAWLSPLKEYRAPIVRTPGDVTSRQESACIAFWQSSRGLISFMLPLACMAFQ